MELEEKIEELELKYLNKYYYFLKFTIDEILEGLKTREKITTQDLYLIQKIGWH